jgi:hypothetical protein
MYTYCVNKDDTLSKVDCKVITVTPIAAGQMKGKSCGHVVGGMIVNGYYLDWSHMVRLLVMDIYCEVPAFMGEATNCLIINNNSRWLVLRTQIRSWELLHLSQ